MVHTYVTRCYQLCPKTSPFLSHSFGRWQLRGGDQDTKLGAIHELQRDLLVTDDPTLPKSRGTEGKDVILCNFESAKTAKIGSLLFQGRSFQQQQSSHWSAPKVYSQSQRALNILETSWNIWDVPDFLSLALGTTKKRTSQLRRRYDSHGSLGVPQLYPGRCLQEGTTILKTQGGCGSWALGFGIKERWSAM